MMNSFPSSVPVLPLSFRLVLQLFQSLYCTVALHHTAWNKTIWEASRFDVTYKYTSFSIFLSMSIPDVLLAPSPSSSLVPCLEAQAILILIFHSILRFFRYFILYNIILYLRSSWLQWRWVFVYWFHYSQNHWFTFHELDTVSVL